MKKGILLVISVYFSCLAFAQQGFTVNGKVEGLASGEIYLISDYARGDTLARGKITDGKFLLQGSVKDVICANFRMKDVANGPVIFLENVDYSVTLKVKEGMTYQDGKKVTMYFLENEVASEIKGGKEQEVANLFWRRLSEAVKKNEALRAEFVVAGSQQDQKKVAELTKKMESLLEEFLKEDDDLIRANADRYATAYIVAELMDDVYEGDVIAHKYGLLGKKARETRYGRQIAKRMEELSDIKVGKKAPDFTLTTVDGNTITLYGTKGKVKIIDFWSPACGPCMEEMPELVKLYEEFHPKGLEFISIGDCDQKLLKQLARRFKMRWLTAGRFKTTDTDVSELYHVKVWPTMVVMDENNQILSFRIGAFGLRELLNQYLNHK